MAMFAFTVEAINRIHEGLDSSDQAIVDSAETMLSVVVLNLKKRSFIIPEEAEESWNLIKLLGEKRKRISKKQ